MSSAAKLRKYGRGTAVAATAAIVMTSFGPAAFASWDDAPQTSATAETSANTGTIGIVDTDKAAVDNQGATLVQPGKSGQAIADVRMTLPNKFVSGDMVELRVFDRSATAANDGTNNSGPDYAVGFSADPKVAVSEPVDDDTIVSADTDDPRTRNGAPVSAGNAAANTETDPVNAWKATGAAGSDTATKPGVAPTFKVERIQSKGQQGYDIIRLTHTGNPSTGDPDAKWVVSLSDLKVDLGARVTPGALRIVPFAISKANSGTSYSNSTWFYGNRTPNTFVASGDGTAVTTRQIGIYTVPAFVSPMALTVDNPDIIADGSAQNIGNVTLTEGHPAGVDNGQYTLTIAGASIASTAQQLQGKVTGGGASETITINSVNTSTGQITFTVSGADPKTAASYALSGIQLSKPAGSAGRVTYRLSGGSIDNYIPNPEAAAPARYAGQGTQPITFAGQALFAAESAFCAGVPGGVVATQPTVTVTAPNAVTATLTGDVQLRNGPYTIGGTSGLYTLLSDTTVVGRSSDTNLADGATFTLEAPYNGSLALGPGLTGGTTVTVSGAPATNPTTTNVTGDALAWTGPTPALGSGTYTMTVADTNGSAADGNQLTITDEAEDVVFQSAATITDAVRDGGNSTPVAISLAPVAAGGYTGNSSVSFTPAANSALTTTRTFTVADPTSVTAATAPADQNNFTVTENPGASARVLTPGDTFTVNQTSTGWELLAPGGTTVVATATNANPRTFSTATGTITLSGDPVDTMTIAVGAAGSVAVPCVNQDDILAGDALLVTGSARAGTNAIGGTDRFGTARKVAKAYSAYGDTAIIVNGMNFPDALSSGFLSQREGAPILLTAQGFVPQDTIESLRERGVRKVYVVGGASAVGSKVVETLRGQAAYMYDEAAGGIKPRGGNLEVIQLGGQDRYQTNWVVNTYAAAQTANAAPVGKIAVKSGQPYKTTALIARGDQFADALTANVLTAGRIGSVVSTTGKSVTVPGSGATLVNPADAQYLADGTYTVNQVQMAGGPPATYRYELIRNGVVVAESGSATGSVAGNGSSFIIPAAGGAPARTIQFNRALVGADSFVVRTGAYVADPNASRINALPVILTPSTGLHKHAADEIKALHIEHALLIGGDSALNKKVNDDVAGLNATSWRLEGKDRFDTARVVNEFAMAPVNPADANAVPGLGFDGGAVYTSAGAVDTEANSDWVAYLANGIKFPDALVAGPWISRSRDAMLMTTGNDLTDPSRQFLKENANRIDRAAGLGLGDAVTSAVVTEANKLAAGQQSAPTPTATPTATPTK